jgi:hypothetical protein
MPKNGNIRRCQFTHEVYLILYYEKIMFGIHLLWVYLIYKFICLKRLHILMFQVLDFVRCFFFTFKLLKANVNFGRCTFDAPKFKVNLLRLMFGVWVYGLGLIFKDKGSRFLRFKGLRTFSSQNLITRGILPSKWSFCMFEVDKTQGTFFSQIWNNNFSILINFAWLKHTYFPSRFVVFL